MIPQYETAICRYCGKKFKRKLKNSGRKKAADIRPSNAFNCSRKCSWDYNVEIKPKIAYQKRKDKQNGNK